MGFHYPAAEYAKYIQANADSGAALIYDHRKGYDDNSLQNILLFSEIVDVDDGPKSARIYLKMK